MEKKDIKALAEELRERIPVQPSFPMMNVDIWADEDNGCINCAPSEGGKFGDTVIYVKEIARFAEYHDLSLHTKTFARGAGLELLL